MHNFIKGFSIRRESLAAFWNSVWQTNIECECASHFPLGWII